MKKFLLITIAVIAVLLIALRLALPTITEQAIIYGIESATPYQAEVGDVSYDVYEGKAALSDVTLRLKDVIELNIKDFNFDLIWQPLLDGKVALDKVQLAGVSTKVLMDKERLEVAGYDLNNPPPSPDEDQAAAKDSGEEDEPSTEAEPSDGTLPVVIGGVNIENTLVNFTGENGTKAKFLIEALKVSAIDLSRKDQPAAVDARLKIDSSPITIAGDVYPLDLAQTSALTIKMTEVNIGQLVKLVKSKLPPEMAVAGILSTDLATTFAIDQSPEPPAGSAAAEPAKIDLSAKGVIGLKSFDFSQPGMAASFAELKLNLANKVLLKGDKYQVSGPVAVDLATVKFAGQDGLNVKAASVAVAQELGVSTDRVTADGTIKVGKLGYSQPPTIAEVAAIDLRTAAKLQGDAPSGTVSGTIKGILTRETAAPQAKTKGEPKGKPKGKPQGKKTANKSSKAAKPPSDEPVFQATSLALTDVALASLQPLAVTAGRITLNDFILAYPYKNKGIDYDKSVVDLSQLTLNVDNFNDGTKAGQQGKLAFKTKIGKTGKITVNGTSKTPKVDKTTVKLKANVDALDLTDFSGFFMQQMGYRIERGSLNADVKVAKNTKDDLDGNAKILLAKLQVASKDRRGKTLKNRSTVPLESSLSMTKDDSDNLPLEFPITGNLNSPSFSPRILLTEKLSEILVDQLTQSLGTAIVSNYLPMLASSVTLSPALVYSLLKKGVDVATKLRFKPVPFGVNSAIPAKKGMAVLATVGKNLSSRPNLILKFCTKAYYSETANTAQVGEKPPAKLNEARVKKAFALADKRLAFVRRNLLRRSKKIKAKQIVTCKPTLEAEATASPELTIAI